MDFKNKDRLSSLRSKFTIRLFKKIILSSRSNTLFKFNLRGFRRLCLESKIFSKRIFYCVKIKNINAHLTVLDKQIRNDRFLHNIVSEYDDPNINISYN